MVTFLVFIVFSWELPMKDERIPNITINMENLGQKTLYSASGRDNLGYEGSTIRSPGIFAKTQRLLFIFLNFLRERGTQASGSDFTS